MKSRNILTSIVLLTSIFITTIVYSAFSTQLNIEGEAIVRTDQEIRITNITVKSSSNGAYESYNNKYNKDTTSMYVTLPSNSSITYEVEITNKGNDSYLIDSITQESHTNSNVNVEISLKENDIVESNNTKTFTITLTNNTSSEQQETLVYKYGFKLNKFIVSFDANGGSVSQTSKEVSYGNSYGTLPTPTRAGYKFLGWNGKNMFNIDDYIETYRPYIQYSYAPQKTTFDGYDVWKVYGRIELDGLNLHYMEGKFKENTPYTFYIDQYEVKHDNGYYGITLYAEHNDTMGQDTTSLIYHGYNQIWHQQVNTTPSDKTIRYIRTSYGTSVAYSYIRGISIEEGNKFTGYEPYYIESSTTVVQPNNHTLKAMWLKIAPENCNGDDIVCINNYSDLVRLRDEVNAGDNKAGKYYFLTSDIDMGGLFDSSGTMLTGSTNWVAIGDSEQTPFSGSFDGNGHIINNLYINTSNQNNALFGYLINGYIKNLGIDNSFIINDTYPASAFIGTGGRAIIDRCYNNATVNGLKGTAGFAASIYNNSSITNSYNKGTINNNSKQFAGGFVGYSGGTVKNCYNSGNIQNGSETGGIVGGLTGYVLNTYNVGYIQTSGSHAGIAGQLYGGGTIENSYSSGDLGLYNRSGIVASINSTMNQRLKNNYYLNTTAEYGILGSSNSNFTSKTDNNTTPLTASEMPTVISVINGDNAFVEDTDNINNGYPILKWEANR